MNDFNSISTFFISFLRLNSVNIKYINMIMVQNDQDHEAPDYASTRIPPCDINQNHKNSFSSQCSLPLTKINVEQICSVSERDLIVNNESKVLIEELPQETINIKERKDRMGNIIVKGKKQHHITFRDTITERNIADVIVVQSYKKYNDTSFDDDDDSCECLLL